MAIGAVRGVGAEANGGTGGGVDWSAIAPFYRTAKQKQGAVPAELRSTAR
jgi:hypothetical protein